MCAIVADRTSQFESTLTALQHLVMHIITKKETKNKRIDIHTCPQNDFDIWEGNKDT